MTDEKIMTLMIAEMEKGLIKKLQYPKNFYLRTYLFCKKQMGLKCQICEELEEQNLPYDCLQRPHYCVKKPLFQQYIIAYEGYKIRLSILNN